MKMKYGIDVVSWDNEKVGKLEHVVMNPATNEITHLVVKKGMLISNDKVIPISMVQGVMSEGEAERIKLYAFEGDYEDFDDYIEVNYVRAEKKRAKDLTGEEGDELVPLLAYPPAGILGFGYLPVIQYPGEEGIELQKNLPEGSVELRQGASVIGLNGEHVGDIQELIYETTTGEITHLVISKGIVFSDEKCIPVSWVTDYDRNEVKLAVASDLVDALPKYQG